MGFALNRKIYENLPIAIKQLIGIIPFSFFAGKSYRNTVARGNFFTSASRDEIIAFQQTALRKTLQFVTDQVPAYRSLRRIVERYPALDAIKEFPLIDKDVLQQNLANYLPRAFEKIPHYKVTTGGTSGNQLALYLDDKSQSIEMGFVHRFWSQMGYTPRCRKATFRGVSFNTLAADTFWQHNPIYNEVQFSPFTMSEQNLPKYIEEIARYKPEYLHGYPSAIDIIAEFILRNRLEGQIPRIKAAFLASEGCSEFQRQRIESAFRTRVFSWYGHTERLIFGGECEKTTDYHQIPDYGLLEVVDESGATCKEHERGEIVGTGFLNRCLPLVRYRTGDYAEKIDYRCACGRNWDRFRNVEGHRKQEMVIGKTGARISIAALNMHGALFDKVIRYQYYQDTPGICELRLMVAPDFTEHHKKEIQKAYFAKVGSELEMKAIVVDEIPLTARGKLKFLVSKLT